jgi:epoxyqueuosine reductase
MPTVARIEARVRVEGQRKGWPGSVRGAFRMPLPPRPPAIPRVTESGAPASPSSVEVVERTRDVRTAARALGFDAVAIARADAPLEADYDRYRAFLAEEMQGEMGYLADFADVRRRLDTGAILEGARSVVCLARRYQRAAADEEQDPVLARRIARYARGRDYHNVVRKKLRKLAATLRALGTADAPARARPMCDDVPVLERAWAARAGLGFVGKNGMLIVPGEGSFVLLGEVVTTLELTPDTPMHERCGSCTRCLDACPTAAFVAPFVLDPRRCIAYLTIELRSAIPEPLRAPIGEHLFGCDDCQTACPFNHSARPRDPGAQRPFEPHARWGETDTAALLAMDDAAWGRIGSGTPVHRATADGLARNAAIVLGNTRDVASVPSLRAAAAAHPSAVVREAASWALGRIGAVAGEK